MRIFFACWLLLFSRLSPISEPSVLLIVPIFWIAGGLVLTGARQGEGSRKILAAGIIDLVPAVFFSYATRSPILVGSYLFPFLDAALGDGSLFNIVGGIGVLELLVPGAVRKPSILASPHFYAPIVPLLLSLLFAVYVFRFYKQSRRSVTLISLIEVGQSLGSTLSMNVVLDSLENALSSLYHYNVFVLGLVDEQWGTVHVKINRSPLPGAFADFALDNESILARVLKDRQGVIVRDLKTARDSLIPALKTFRSAAILPLQFEGASLGFFLLIHPYPAYFEEEDLRVLSILANQAAVSVKNVLLHEKTAVLAITDSLTGLYTHGYFQTVLQDRLTEQARNGKPASVLMVDLDWFKKVNDTFGHPQGDRVLAQLGRLVKNVLTPRDILARYGGDEFVAYIADSNKMAAVALAERIRSTIQDVPFMIPGTEKSIRLSVSIGVAGFPEDGSGSALIGVADKALYQAKQSGRNKVMYSSQEAPAAELRPKT